MSYAITVKVTDGVPVIAGQSGDIPDGTINISGHGSDQHVSIGVTVIQPDGLPVVQASGVGHPHPFAAKPAEAEAEASKL